MNKRGFTLVEVLVTIVIIALLSGVGVLSYRTFFKTGEEKYFDATESNVLLAGNDYFTDHRDLLPVGNGVSEVSLSELVESKYIEKVTDSKGNVCTTGKVYAYRENNKYVYEVCMECGGIKSSGKYCDGMINRNIVITAKTISGKNYDVTASYNLVSYTNNENVLVTFNMDNYVVKKYEIVNTKTNYSKSCSGKTCAIEVDKSGTYKVTAYDESNEIVATNQYINVKIARNGPAFTISGANKVVLSKAESACKSDGSSPKKRVTYTIVKGNINEEYKNIKYRFNRKDDDADIVYGDYKETNGLVITEDLESGKYELEVVISNFADNNTNPESEDVRISIKTKEFYVSYLIDLEYEVEDGNPHPVATHEVVKGQKYDFVSELPKRRTAYGQSLEVRWHPLGTEYSDAVRIYGTTKVTANCTHRLLGLISIPVDVPNDWTTYCANVTYNGGSQTITKTPPTNVSFTNNTGIDAGEYTVKAHIDSPLYIWKGEWTFTDKTFKCSIAKKSVAVTWSNLEFTYNGYAQGPTASVSGVTGETINLTQKTEINAGSYTASTSCSSVTGGRQKCSNYNITNTSKGFVIKKADNPIVLTCSESLVYNGSDQTLLSSKTATAGDVYISTSSLNETNYSTTGGTALSKAQGKNANNYTVYAYTPGNSNYKSNSTSKTCSIAKATNSITLNCASITYNGSNQNLLSSKTATAGDVYISTSSLNGTNYSTTGGTALSSAQGKGGGNHTVYAYTPGNSNYNVATSSKTCSIAKAANPISVTASQSWNTAYSTSAQTKNITAATNAQGSVTYTIKSQKKNGSNVSNFSISGSKLTMSGSTGTGSYEVVIKAEAAGNSNYNSGSKDITMTVIVYASTTSAFSSGTPNFTHVFGVSGLNNIISAQSSNGTVSCSKSGSNASCTVSNMTGSTVSNQTDCISIYGSDTYYYSNGCYTYLGLGHGYNPTTQQWWCWDEKYDWNNHPDPKPPGPNGHCQNYYTTVCKDTKDCIAVGNKQNPENSKQNVCICYRKSTSTKYTATITLNYY